MTKKQLGLRALFAERFGEEEAARFESAAEMHAECPLRFSAGNPDKGRGSDPFRWTLLQVISFQCAEIEGYRKYHGIVSTWSDVKAWIKEHARLGEHDGEFDGFGAMAGAFRDFMEKE